MRGVERPDDVARGLRGGGRTRERVHPQRTRFGAKATRSDERPQLLNFSSFAVVEINNDPGLWPVMHMPRRRRKRKNPSGLMRLILFICARIAHDPKPQREIQKII